MQRICSFDLSPGEHVTHAPCVFNPRSISQLVSYVQSFSEKIGKNKPPPRGRSHPFHGGFGGSSREVGLGAGDGRCALGARTRHGRCLQVQAHREFGHRARGLRVLVGHDGAWLRGRRVVGRSHVEVLFAAEGGRVGALRSGSNARAVLGLVVALRDDEGRRAFLDGLLVQRGSGLDVDVGAEGIAGEGRRCQAGE